MHRLISYYEKLAHHADWNSGDWANEKIMNELFHDFTSVYDVNDKTILDAGCGVGELYQYITDSNLHPREVGLIDLVPALIEKLKINHPEIVQRNWLVDAINFFDFVPPKQYDIVTMFGLAPCVNHQYQDKIVGLKKLVELGLSACNEALYINFLNAEYEDIEPMTDDMYVTFHPFEVTQVLYNIHYTLYNHGFSFFSVLIRKENFIHHNEVINKNKLLNYT